jgi:hypothetical protein
MNIEPCNVNRNSLRGNKEEKYSQKGNKHEKKLFKNHAIFIISRAYFEKYICYWIPSFLSFIHVIIQWKLFSKFKICIKDTRYSLQTQLLLSLPSSITEEHYKYSILLKIYIKSLFIKNAYGFISFIANFHIVNFSFKLFITLIIL